MEANSNHRYCNHCGDPIETHSKKCPNCGRIYRKSKTGLVILLVLLGVVVLSVGAYFAFKLIPPKQSTELSAEEIYQLASPATVEIRVETEYGNAIGTGFFDGADGTIITNFHVIDGATSGSVYLSNGERYDILKLVGFNRNLDIAIIQTDYQPTSSLQARTDLLQTGETVYALGSSVGLSDSFSQGVISANQRKISGQIFIQTTAPISHGNSGGPLIDKYGKVVGITTAGIETGQNLNLAIPISAVNKIDRSNPIGFPGRLSYFEWISIKEADISYWDWIDGNRIIVEEQHTSVDGITVFIYDPSTKIYHWGTCFESVMSKYEGTKTNYQIGLALAVQLGYTPCPQCE